jgi:crossover junction endodeoxyribonuclease RuvC
MIKLLLGLTKPPSPHDAADALAVAICHLHSLPPSRLAEAPGGDRQAPTARMPRTWRDYRPPANG